MFVSPLNLSNRVVRQNSVAQIIARSSARSFARSRNLKTPQALLAAACNPVPSVLIEALEHRTLLSSAVLGPQLTYGVAGAPVSVVAANLTGDGLKDIITANTNGTVSILLNAGNGELNTAATISDGLGNSANSYANIVTADFNGDGHTDLAVINGTDQVSILLGNGDGTFQAPKLTTLSANIDGVAAADFNGDGHTDLALSLDTNVSGSGVVATLLGNDDGSFEAQRNIYVGTAIAVSVTEADFNNDGKPDLVVGQANGTVFTLINNGSALASPTQVYAGPSGKFNVLAGDVNLDGNADIIIGLPDQTTRVLLGNGNGTFAAPITDAVNLGIDGHSAALADMNGDGLPDLVAANYANNTITVALGNGDGTFKASAAVSYNTPHSTALLVADLAGAGKPDIVAVSYSSKTVDLLLNTTTTGTFFAPPSTLAIANSPEFVASADLTGNGLSDIVESNFNQNTIEVFLANGDGTFKAPQVYSVPAGPSTIIIGDLNNDQKPDIVVASTGAETVSVLLGNGDGTFKAAIVTTPGIGLDRGPNSIALGNINGDSNLDVVIAEPFVPGFGVLFGNGDGTFQTIVNQAVPGTLPEPYGVAVADLNGDGKADVALTDVQNNQVDVFLNNGSGSFNTPTTYSVDFDPASIAIGNLTSANHPDIVTSSDAASGAVSVLLGNGDGTFAAQHSFPTAPHAFQVAIQDLNGDGNPDIITTNPGTLGTAANEIAFLRGNGDGTFTQPQAITVGAYPRSIAIGDFTGDGSSDFVTANTNDNSLSLIINTSGGTLATIVQTTLTSVTVTGTPVDDSASITYSSGNVLIDIDGVSRSIPVADAQSILVNLGNGDDSINIGPGVPAVSVNGGAGNDSITSADSSADTLAGTGGNDSIESGSGASLVMGGAGNDTLTGGGKGAQLLGNSGNDLIVSTGKHVTVVGGGGNDTLAGNGKRDSLRGGPGDDFLLDGFTGSVPVGDTLNGGAGMNFAQVNPNDIIKNVFEFIDPEQPPQAPTPAVAPAAQAIQPLDSSVTATVTNGKLKIVGTPGDDSIFVSFDGTNLIVSAGGSQIDTVPAAGLIGIRINGGAGNDTLTLDPSVLLPATLVGGAGNDSLTGGGADNVLVGGAGSDTLVGGAGTNLLIPDDRDTFENTPSGNDVLDGGAGYSIADFAYRTDALHLNADSTNDSGDTGAGEATTIDSNIAAIFGGTGADTINGVIGGKFLSGGAGADSITGGGANDIILGGAGANTVTATSQPVALFLRNGLADSFTGAADVGLDVLQLDATLDT